MPTFINLTRQNEIGANCYYLELDGQGIVLDAGMHPKFDGYAALPQLELIDERNLRAVFITHAHHDHIGALPLLMRRHPEAKVFADEGTFHLADPLLRNSISIMKKKRKAGLREYPLYTHRDVGEMFKRTEACRLNKKRALNGFFSGFLGDTSFQFHHAGHILGSVAVEIRHRGKRILYTGDFNLRNQTITTAARLPEKSVDTLIVETTRGDNPAPDYNRENVIASLIGAISEVFDAGGAVLIPVFALGKTQEVLTILHQAQMKGNLPAGPIYIGGLSKVFTEIHDQLKANPHFPMLKKIQPEIMSGRMVEKFRPQRGHIYLISSGMMTENTLSNIFAQKILPREKDAIFFVGYSDPDSPAGKLRATPRGESVKLGGKMEEQIASCQVRHFDLTAHALREDILAYIQRLNPRQCLLVHGDPPALEWFRQQLKISSPSINVIIPAPGEEIVF